jgi:subtilase family serine protease
MRRRARNALGAILSAALAAGVVVSAATSADASALVPLAGSTPSWATEAHAVGPVDPSAQLTIEVTLPLRDQAAAEQLALAVSDPSSRSYGHYVSAAEFNARFAPTADQVAAVSSWLGEQGFAVSADVPSNNRYVRATGTAELAQRVFHTELKTYRVDGQTVRGAAAPAQIPASLRSDIQGVLGLNQITATPTTAYRNEVEGALSGPSERRSGPQERSAPAPEQRSAPAPRRGQSPAADPRQCGAGEALYWGQYNYDPHYASDPDVSNLLCGYSPQQLAGAYQVPARAGSGQTIGIVGVYRSPTLMQDQLRYFHDFGLAPLNSRTLVFEGVGPSDPDNPFADGWFGEQLLDIETAHTIAPEASIRYYGADPDVDGSLYDGVNALVAADRVSIISNSWTNMLAPTAGEVANANAIFVQASAQGIGVYFSSGDTGDETHNPNPQYRSDTPFTHFPASSVWVTAVGGTSLGLAADNSKTLETGWETGIGYWNGAAYQPMASPSYPGGFLFGAGGGSADTFAAPSWQARVVPPSVSGGHRAVPDVSALADPYTGLMVGATRTPFDASGHPAGAAQYVLIPTGGTSLATPIIAALVADAQAAQQGMRFGLITPLLYDGAAKRSTIVTDVQHVDSHEYLGQSGGVDLAVSFDQVFGPDPAIGIAASSSLQAGPRWDNVTGIGTPDGSRFFTCLGQPVRGACR